MTAGSGGMGGSSKPWGVPAARTPAINQHQPSIGTDTLKGATSHLHMEHPHHVQGEGLQHRGEEGIHHPVHQPVYGGRMKR